MSDYKGDYYRERFWDDPQDKPRHWKIFGVFLAVIVVLAVVLGLLGLALGWFNQGVKVVSPANVTAQYKGVITEWEALKASANNACAAVNGASDVNSPTMVEDPAFAYAATYRKIVVEYNARQKNVFEAGLVGPQGYPKEVPLLDEGPTTDWCSVAGQLALIK